MAAAERRRLGLLLTTALILAGCALRLGNFFDALEYDEIWTLEFFAGASPAEIFTNLSLPNNHPINSLLVKLVTTFNPAVCWIRLPAWLAGVLSLPLIGYVALRWSGKRDVALWSLAFFAFSIPAAYYAQQARGYSLQLFFLLLFTAGLLAAHRRRNNRFRYWPEVAVFLGGAGAVLTLPTSILYLGALTLTGMIVRRGKTLLRPASLAWTLGTGVVLTLLWYGINFSKFRAAQAWGFDVTGVIPFCNYVLETITMLIPPVQLVLAAAALFLAFRRNLPLTVPLLLPLVAALATQGGPPRTCLPFTALFAVWAGSGAATFLRRLPRKPRTLTLLVGTVIAGALLLSCPAMRTKWRNIDWYALCREIRELPPQTVVILGANAGNPYRWNNYPEAAADHLARLEDSSPQRGLLILAPPDRMNGIDASGGEREFAMNLPGRPPQRKLAGLTANEYRLRELAGPPEAGAVVLAIIRPLPSPAVTAVTRRLAPAGEWLQANPWLSDVPFEGAEHLRTRLLAGRITDPSGIDWNNFRRETGDRVTLYTVEPAGNGK